MKAGFSRTGGYFPIIVYLLCLLLNLILVIQVLAGLGVENTAYFFSSDGLYLPAIYRDFFIDGNGLRGWNLNAAPNFFPEWPMYFLIRALSGDLRLAAMIYALFQFLVFSLLLTAIYRIVSEKRGYYFSVLIQSGLTLFLLVYYLNHDFRTISYLFFQGFHNGAVIMALASTALTFAYLKKARTATLLLLFFSVMLATFSDRLYIGMFTLPLITLAFFLPFRGDRRRLLYILAATGLASATGLLLFRWLQMSHYIYIISPGGKSLNFSNIADSLRIFLDHMHGMISHGGPRGWITSVTGIVFVAGLLFILAGIRRSLRRLRGREILEQAGLENMFIFFSSALVLIVILVPLSNGSYIGRAIFRYMIFAFYYALPFAIFLIDRAGARSRIHPRLIPWLSMGLAVFLLGFTLRNHIRENSIEGWKDFMSYYPADARALDNLAREHDLHSGIGNYWYAKHLTMFSREGVRIYSVFDNLHAWFHVTNQNWFFTGDFNFVLGNNMKDQGSLERIFGRDIDTVSSEGLLVYKVPEFVFDEQTRDPVRKDSIPSY